jgi:hypothetical protein
MTAIPAAMLGITLAAATAACQPTDGGGGKSTAEVCADLDNNLIPLAGSVTTSAFQLPFYPDPPSPTDQAHIVSVTRQNFDQLSSFLRDEASYANDENMATALENTADSVDARAATVNTISDVAKVDGHAVDMSPLYPFCPGLQEELGG